LKAFNTTVLLILFATAIVMVSNSWTSLSGAFVSSHSSSSRTSSPAAAAKPAFGPGLAIYQVRLYYQANLRDYGSARFDWGNFTGTELVFTLNAKNGFGAFTGPRRMVAIFVNGKLSRIAG
jgi:hypothetical protein